MAVIDSFYKYFFSLVIVPTLIAGNEVCSAETLPEVDLEALYELPVNKLSQLRIITSTLYEETLTSAPSAITVITRDQIHRMGFDRLEQLMNYVPGFQSYRSDFDGHQRVYSSRGRRTGDTGVEILLLIDGVSQNNDWSGGATFHNTAFSLENVDRVEFIRGPGSSIYGSNAFLGVINIITTGKRELQLETHNNSGHKAIVQWQWSEEKGDGQASIYAKDSRNDGESIDIFNPDPGINKMMATSTPNQQQNLYLTARKSGLSLQASYSDIETKQFYFSGFASNQHNLYDRQSYYLNASYEFDIHPYWSVTASAHSSTKKSHFRALASSLLPLSYEGEIDEQELGSNILARYNYLNTKALFGFEYRQPDITNTETQTIGVINDQFSLGQEGKRTIRGWYGQYQYRFNSKWESIFGGRYDSYSDCNSHFSPRVGLIHRLDEANTIKLLYGEAFRSPTRNESSTINNPVITGNPDLGPEISKTTELIWQQQANNGYWQATLFNIIIDDPIVEQTDSSQRINDGHQTITGIELEIQQQFFEYWYALGSTTWITDEADNINNESDTLFSASLSYQRNHFTAAINSYYRNARQDKVNEALSSSGYIEHGGHSVFSANIAYQWPSQLETYLFIDNIFNKQHDSPATNSNNIVGVPNPGRTFQLGFRWQY